MYKAIQHVDFVDAVHKGDIDRVRQHLAERTDTNFQHPRTGLTVLHEAARSGHAEILLALLEDGKTLNLPSRDGRYAAHMADAAGYGMSSDALDRLRAGFKQLEDRTWAEEIRKRMVDENRAVINDPEASKKPGHVAELPDALQYLRKEAHKLEPLGEETLRGMENMTGYFLRGFGLPEIFARYALDNLLRLPREFHEAEKPRELVAACLFLMSDIAVDGGVKPSKAARLFGVDKQTLFKIRDRVLWALDHRLINQPGGPSSA